MKITKDMQEVEVRAEMRGGKGSAIIRQLVKRDLLPEKCRLLAEITLEPGCSIGSHAHEGETEVFYFTWGRGEVDDNGTVVPVTEGDVLVTSNAFHAVENTGDSPLVFTAVILLH